MIIRKIAVLALALCLILALAVPASAQGGFIAVQRSENALRVNGGLADCDKYSIGDYNYFKLRDLAALLDGTAAQFDVDYDEASRKIVVKTGQPYTHRAAGDLVKGTNQYALGRASTQSLVVDGVEQTGISAYYIRLYGKEDGNNYFKLRDLAPILGFSVGYDPDTNAALIGSDILSLGNVRLTETADAGRDYLNRITFLGDSTTYGIGYYYRLGYTDLCPATQVWTPKSGTLTLSYWSTATIVYPTTGEEITIVEAVRRATPEYLLITLGVNGIAMMDKDWFIRDYTALVRAVQEASPRTKLILNSIYPVAPSWKYQGDINNTKIRAANEWIEQIAADTGCRFLYSFESVVGADGNLPESSHNGDGLHLNGETFGVVMQYIRTHKCP